MISSIIRGCLTFKLKSKFSYYLPLSSFRMMTSNKPKNVLVPPITVRGMKELDYDAFSVNVKVPRIIVKACDLEKVLKEVKPLILKMWKLQPVVNHDGDQRKAILLNPNLVSTESDLKQSSVDILKGCEAEFNFYDLKLTYENWRPEDIFEAVLPEEMDKTASYSCIGHIIHLNLRDHLKDYRFLIGKVLLDKLSLVRSVVNKVDIIGNEFRNFNMEVLAGAHDMIVSVKEFNCTYEFDFSQVFWNPRLCTEHERVILTLKKGDSVLYDLFAGVGPFAIPAAKFRKSEVLANDLNPNSYKWLQHNIKLNKVDNRVKAFNMDARDFVRNVVKKDLIDRWDRYLATREDQSVTWPELNFVMNLPAIAVEFLDCFIGLLSDQHQLEISEEFIAPTVICYMFIKDSLDHNEPISKVEEVLKNSRLNLETTVVSFVRSVAPNKEMMKISFKYPRNLLFKSNSCDEAIDDNSPKNKKMKLTDDENN